METMETIPPNQIPPILGDVLEMALARLEAKVFTNQAGLPATIESKSYPTLYGNVNPRGMPEWLKHWTPSDSYHNLPPVENILEEINKTELFIRPAGYKAAGVVLEKSCAHFGVPDNWDVLAGDYIDELSLVPSDLLDETWKQARRECKFFPKIKDLLDFSSSEIQNRKIKLTKLKVMLDYARRMA